MRFISILSRSSAIGIWLVLGPVGSIGSAGDIAIAHTVGREQSVSVAFDGANFLVGIEGDAVAPYDVGAQLVSPSGVLVGGLIPTGRTGGVPLVAFGAGKYLMVWQDDKSYPNDDLWGMFITPAGIPGTPFAISTSTFTENVLGLDFDGSNFLVSYGVGTPAAPKVRFVSPSGAVGSEIALSASVAAETFGNVAFGAGWHLIAWGDGTLGLDVHARFVDASGALGSEFIVSTATVPQNSFVGVSFDGSNFLVVWSRETGGPGTLEWDVYAQRVSPAGTLIGGEIAIAASGKSQMYPFVGFDGMNYLVTWTEGTNDIDQDWVCDGNETTCRDVAAQFVSPSGALVGPPFTITHWPGNQFGSAMAWSGLEYLVVWMDGDQPGGTLGDVYGTLFSPVSDRAPAVYCTSKVNSLGCTPLATWNGAPKITNPAPFRLGAVNVLNNKNGLCFYSTVGAQATVFQGGYLCAKLPIKRTAVQSSGGNPPPNDCSGLYAFDFNAYIASGKDPALVAGRSVWTQYWSRDPGFGPPNSTGLTNAVAFTIAP